MLLAADNIQGLNPAVADAMRDLDPVPITELARLCESQGADLIDINPGYLSARNVDRMAFLVETVQEATSLPLILDSPSAAVLAEGLSACKSRPILNALSLEERKLAEILPLAVENRTRLVLLLMDERSFTPPSLEEKLAIAIELRERCVDAGMDPEALVYDPVLPNLSWEDAARRVVEDLKTVRMLSSGLVIQEAACTMIGLSNLRSGYTSLHPVELEAACLTLFAGAGLSIVLANVLRPQVTEARRLVRAVAFQS